MPLVELSLDADPTVALKTVREASDQRPQLVLKHSPICPVSARAERQVELWLAELGDGDELGLARIDVIAERPLARGLTSELGIRHESPQALWFHRGELVWHGSHGDITRARCEELLRLRYGP
jgi:bacillithiol system protein YtxJ